MAVAAGEKALLPMVANLCEKAQKGVSVRWAYGGMKNRERKAKLTEEWKNEERLVNPLWGQVWETCSLKQEHHK